LNIQKQKVFQLQGGFAPLTSPPGALPLDPAGGGGFAPLTPRPGALPLDPRYRLALRALAMAPFAKS